jgi:hypothetical protein
MPSEIVIDTPDETVTRHWEGTPGVPGYWEVFEVSNAATIAEQTAEANTRTIHTEAEQALAGLRTIRDSTGDLNARNLSNAVRLLARVLIVLVRLQLRRLDGVD